MLERYTLNPREIARGDRALVQTRDGERELRWGQLAPWRGHGGKRGPMVYELDAASVKLKSKRCLVPADGWFAKLHKQPHWFHARGRFTLAGVVATHADDGVESFAIITVPATGIALPIVERMPVLADTRWLDDGELVALPAEWRVAAAPPGNPAQRELF
ncbi:MAG: SOS response-associated peptidase family protein [Deltaproteobacteria bacterium]|nr:SOS response-associated peptidase family protein [Deltaproteobacteria bacterium]